MSSCPLLWWLVLGLALPLSACGGDTQDTPVTWHVCGQPAFVGPCQEPKHD